MQALYLNKKNPNKVIQGKPTEHELRKQNSKQEQETTTQNNDRQTKTGEQRYKYTEKQAKQGNKGVWLIRNT